MCFSNRIGQKIWIKEEKNWISTLMCQFIFLFLSESVFNFKRVTGMLECWSLYANDLPSAVHLSRVQIPSPSNDGCFMLVLFEVRQVQFFGCARPKREWCATPLSSLQNPNHSVSHSVYIIIYYFNVLIGKLPYM